MGILASDIKLLLSGGAANADPAASLGGAASSTVITSAQANNLFDDVSTAEASAGSIEHRCVYVKNGHATDTLLSPKLFLAQPAGGDQEISACLDPVGLNGSAPSIAAETDQVEDYSFQLATMDVDSGSSKMVAYSPSLDRLVMTFSNGTSTAIAWSDDGKTWASSIVGTGSWRGVTWFETAGLFIAVGVAGTGNRIATSPDGKTWTTRAAPIATNWYAIASSDSLAVALSSATTDTMTSPDGINWTHHTSQGGANTIAYSDTLGIFVASGGGGIQWSTDGITWTLVTNPYANALSMLNWVSDIGKFVATTAMGEIATSDDGKVWTAVSTVATFTSGNANVAWINWRSEFFFVHNSGAYYSSPDLINWTEITGVPTIIGPGVISIHPNQKVLTIGSTQNSGNVYYYDQFEYLFSAPTDAASGIALPDLAAGDVVPVWIKRKVNAGAAAVASDPFTLSVTGTPS